MNRLSLSVPSLSPWRAPKIMLSLLLTVGLLSSCGGSGSGAKVVKGNDPCINAQGQDICADTGSITYSGKPSANADIEKFRTALWSNLTLDNRCGSCHQNQAPVFARRDDINLAYNTVLNETLVNLQSPADSRLVTKVATGHNCWETTGAATDNLKTCADIMTTWINNWAGDSSTSVNDITLKAPVDREIGATKSFPEDTSSFKSLLHEPLLEKYCAACHSETAPTRQQPYFASSKIDVAYEAAKTRIRLDNPAQSRLIQRLRNESHNCWSDCAENANAMQLAIQKLADGISSPTVDSKLITSKAVSLGDAFILSSGGRVDSDLIAKYEFKTGQGTTAFDTSGSGIHLNLLGNVSWSSAWGVKLADGGRLQATVASSSILAKNIKFTGEYSVEAWVIPNNIDQGNGTDDPAIIASYSASNNERNFSLGQYDYSYVAMNRPNTNNAEAVDGLPELTTKEADQRVQASLQHVVVTFKPFEGGRRIYVNGEFTGDTDPIADAVLGDWDNSYALALGNEVSGNRPWAGSIRFFGIHQRAMKPEDVRKNFEVGVGAKYLLLFNVSERINQPECFHDAPDDNSYQGNIGDCFIVFEVQQIDDYGYQFAAPFFTNLSGKALSSPVPLKGIRIGVNGTEAPVGQVFANLNATLDTKTERQELSPLGTVIESRSGADNDVFFLTFDQIGAKRYARVVADVPPPAAPADIPDQPTLGLRDFAEINTSLAQMTGIVATTPLVANTYEKVKQQLPTLTNLDGFLAAQQMGITQLTVAYCNALVGSSGAANPARAAFFPGFDFNAAATVAFNSDVKRAQIIEPLLSRLHANEVADGMNPHSKLTHQADPAELRLELNQLIDNMISCGSGCAADRTLTTVKATCAATLGSAVMLLQ
jgi:hypothetical protein